ncbi:MAG: HlyD family secretion protein [Phycisphaerales bacterium]|nr:HlyD family secretion protein [Phycisphaerales bacterium]
MWKWFVAGFLALVVVCGGGGYLVVSSGAFSSRKQVQVVRVEPVARGALTRTVSAPGIVEPRNNRRISAQVVARIRSLPKKEGDHVSKNQLIVQLDDVDLQAALESARASHRAQLAREEQAKTALASAEASLRSRQAQQAGAQAAHDEALAELGRTRELFDSKDVPRSELDRAEADFAQAKSTLDIAKAATEIGERDIERARAETLAAKAAVDIASANITRAQKDLDNTTMLSPIDGIITSLQAEEGELVLVGTFNNPASVIMEIADLSDMLLKARVGENNIASVREGQKAHIYVSAYPAETFEGVVERVGHLRQTWRDGTNYFEVEIKVELQDDLPLRSGLTSSCEIEVETVEGALQVPSQAVVNRRVDELPKSLVDGSPLIDRNKPFANVVLMVRDGTVVAVPVRVGMSDLKSTIILAGLDGTESIITGPYRALQALKPGDEVQIEDTEAPARAAANPAEGGG